MDFVAIKNPKFLAVMDLSQGYFYMSVAEDSRKYTGIITPDYRMYHFIRLPFGLNTAPSSFQLLLRSVLGDLEGTIVTIYMDDLLTCNDTFQGLLDDLQVIFDWLAEANLTLQISKCEFAVKEVKYLGHIFGQGTLKPNPDKVKIVADMKSPKNIKQLIQALGLMNYFKKFMKDYSKIAKPLYELLKKEAEYLWTEEHEKAFNKLKSLLVNAPMLVLQNFTEDFTDRVFIFES